MAESPAEQRPVSPERSSPEELARQVAYFEEANEITPWLNALPDGVLILNSNRQIVFSNTAMDRLVGDTCKSAAGLRTGELFGCRNAIAGGGDCGNTPFCRVCGALTAILNSYRGTADVQEYRIVHGKAGEALNLLATATPVRTGNGTFTVFAVRDISDRTRRQNLEHLFFHDILNIAISVRGFASMLEMADDLGEAKELGGSLRELGEELVAKLSAHKELTWAEEGRLEPRINSLRSLEVLKEQLRVFTARETGMACRIAIDPAAEDTTFDSDGTALARVLACLVQNAAEASTTEEEVVLSCMVEADRVCFTVHNSAVMPDDVQLQIFQQSFSTKGHGRGLGTYSARLLTEKYLGGLISFTSTAGAGTTFAVRCPLALPGAEH